MSSEPEGSATADDSPGEDGDGDEDWWNDSEPEPPVPGPDVPAVDVPEVGTPDWSAGDADPETVRTFWRLVVVVDVCLLALALGPMFIYFEGNWRGGLAMTGFGLVVLAYGVVVYRRYRADDSGDDGDTAGGGTDDGDVDDPKG